MEKKKVKIVFIDIDGVFNHLSYYKSHRFCDGRTYPLSEFDPECVKRYMRIIEKTGAKTVISSSWRFTDGLRNIMEQVGFYGSALEYETTPYLGTIRGLEIFSYLDRYEDTHKGEEVELGIFVEGVSTFRDIYVVVEGSYDVTIWETPHNNVITKED